MFISQTNVCEKGRRGFGQERSVGLNDAQLCAQEEMNPLNKTRQKVHKCNSDPRRRIVAPERMQTIASL